MNFKDKFVKSLQSKVSDKVMELDLDFDDKSKPLAQCARFKNGELDSVYITVVLNGKNIKNSQAILKFKETGDEDINFQFTHIYIRESDNKGKLEKRYDSDMNEVSDYYFATSVSNLKDNVFCKKIDYDNPDVEVIYLRDKEDSLDFSYNLSILKHLDLVDDIDSYDNNFFRKGGDDDIYMVFKSKVK